MHEYRESFCFIHTFIYFYMIKHLYHTVKLALVITITMTIFDVTLLTTPFLYIQYALETIQLNKYM